MTSTQDLAETDSREATDQAKLYLTYSTLGIVNRRRPPFGPFAVCIIQVERIRSWGGDLREIAYWAAFDDSIVIFMVNVEDPKFHDWVYANRELLSQSTQRYQSVDELKEELDEQGRAFVERLETLMVLDELLNLAMNLLRASPVLIDPDWLSVAKDPQKFNRGLNLVTNSIKRSMKMLYGLPSHRPPAKTVRDRRIWVLKRRRADLSFGQIGVKFHISGKSAERAYNLSVKERSRSS